MNDLKATVDTYLSARNETDPALRAELIERAWATDGRLIDPPIAAEGHAGINDLVSAQHAQFPGLRFRRSSGIDLHHDQLRFAWEFVGPGGAVALAGLDVGELAGDRRLQRITGFFGELPASDGFGVAV